MGSGPARTSRARSRSSAERAMGPSTAMSGVLRVPGGPGMWPRVGTMPKLGLRVKTPVLWAGWRSEPRMSLPSSRPVSPAATAAAAPPDEPPGVAVQVPGVVGGAEDRVRGLPVHGVDRQVGLAEDDRPFTAQPGDGVGVAGRHVCGEVRRAGGGAHPGGLQRVLDRHRQAVQRAGRVSACGGPVGGVGRCSGAVDVERHDRVQRGVSDLDAVQVGVEELSAADLAVSQGGDEGARGDGVKVEVVGVRGGGGVAAVVAAVAAVVAAVVAAMVGSFGRGGVGRPRRSPPPGVGHIGGSPLLAPRLGSGLGTKPTPTMTSCRCPTCRPSRRRRARES